MSWGFALLFVAACAFVAFAASALSGAMIIPVERALGRVHAHGRARIWLLFSFLPLFASVLVVVGAFGPWMGLTPDHCATHFEEHVHLCFGHQARSASLFLILPASALATRIAQRILRAAERVLRARRVRGELLAVQTATVGDVHVLPLGEANAFVLGYWSPTLFVSRALLEGPASEVEAVLAHERAHADRRDPLRRLVAFLALAFHLPGIADALERRIGVAQEMAADAHAAGQLGDPVRVAEALLTVARGQTAHRGHGAIPERIIELLNETPQYGGPPLRALFAGVAFAFMTVALGAGAVHHLLESALSFLGA